MATSPTEQRGQELRLERRLPRAIRDEMADRAARLSADVLDPPRDTPGVRAALVADPRGATFSITQFL